MSEPQSHDLLLLGGGNAALTLLQTLHSQADCRSLLLVDARPQLSDALQQELTRLEALGIQCQSRLLTEVTDLHRDTEGNYQLHTAEGQRLCGQRLWVAAGSTTLLLAQRMGYGQEYTLLPLAGYRYHTDTGQTGEIRYFSPCLEQHNLTGLKHYLQLLQLSSGKLAPLFCLFRNIQARKALAASLIYGWPWLGQGFIRRRLNRLQPQAPAAQVRFEEKLPLIRCILQTDTAEMLQQPWRLEIDGTLLFSMGNISSQTPPDSHQEAAEKTVSDQDGISSDR